MMLHPNRVIYKRSIYSFLNWLGDVGGLMDGLRVIGSIFMFFYTSFVANPLYTYLISTVFKVAKVDNTE